MRSLRAIRFALYMLCSIVPFLSVASAQIPATDDAYTASSSASSNYGTGSQLNVIGPGVNSYIRFDLTMLPAGLTSSNVSKATLRLNINGVTTSGTFDVYLVTKSWTEGALTFNNAPTLGIKVASALMITTSKRNFLDVDVTAAVQGWLSSPTPSPNYGIALVPSSGSSISVSFDSKENTSTSHDPELIVSIISSGQQGPPGPQGTAGATGPQGPAGPAGSAGPQGASGAAGSLGPQGVTGPQGVPGLMGLSGPQGNPGPQGPAGVAFIFKGPFDNSGTYAANDVVSFNGSSYVAQGATHPDDPAPDTNPTWSLMAQRGAAASAGEVGPQGPQGPSGVQGEIGPTGPQGPSGLQGPRGVDGAPGTTGQSATTVFSTGAITITNNSGFAPVPGVSVTMNIQGNTIVIVNTEGGVATTSGSASGFSMVDITLAVDGRIVNNGGYQRLTVSNNTGLTGQYGYWSITQALTLPSGPHTFEVFTAGNPGGGANAIVGGDSLSVLQAEMTVSVLKQ